MKLYKKLILPAALLLGLSACESVDPFDVVNPNLSEDALIGQPNSASIWLNGIKRQVAITTNNTVIAAEIASDNYQNTNTFYNQFLDNLTIDYQDDDLDDAQFHIARLREMALYGVEEVGPNDPNYSDEVEAEFLFYMGYSHLLAGEYFKVLAASPGGELQPRLAHYDLAVQYFTESYNIDQNTAALLARARANYHLGNETEAVADAQGALAAEPEFILYANFDPQNSTGNNNSLNYTVNDLQDALYDRGSFDDLQPLPRLDFLDPKFSVISSNEDAAIPILKAEEAHLIIAESAVSNADALGAQTSLQALLGLVSQRPTRSINDAAENRSERDPGSRPDTSAVVIDGMAGLVLDRSSGNIVVPVVSGTSVDTATILATAIGDNMLELVYLMRQEIFIAEGRRFTDMGLTFVISQNEQQLNENVTGADIVADIPPFIDAVKGDLDAFTYDASALTASITVNVNSIIVANKTSPYVCPFE